MGWNSAYTKLTNPIGWGDISRATGVAGPPYTMGDMYTRATILNKYSKIKPVECASNPGVLTAAQYKAANYGLSIPAYTSAAELTTALRTGVVAGGHWTHVKPTTWFRPDDLDGYVPLAVVTEEWNTLGPDGQTALRFPFAGLMVTSDAILGPYSAIISAALDWEDTELHGSGLLYPKDFQGTALDLSEMYFGLLLTPNTVPSSGNTDLWIVTCADKLKEDDNLLSNIPFTQGESTTSIGHGNYNLFPILCTIPHNNAGNPVFQNYKNSWSGEGGGPGKLILLDGYRLPVQLTYVSDVMEITFTMTGSSQINMTIKNKLTRFYVDIYGTQMFCYLMSGYVAARTMSEDVGDAADEWVDDGTENTQSVKNSNNKIIGRYVDMFSAFRTANGNSSRLAAGASVSFSVAVGASADGLGYSYGSDSEMYFCYDYGVQGHGHERVYDLLEQ